MVSVSRSNGDDVEDVIYELELKRGVAYKELLERLAATVKPESGECACGRRLRERLSGLHRRRRAAVPEKMRETLDFRAKKEEAET